AAAAAGRLRPAGVRHRRPAGLRHRQQSSYDGGYYAPAGQAPQNDAFASNGAYPDTAYPEAPAPDRTPAGASSGSFPGFDDRRREDDWPQADGYQNGYPAQYPADTQESESTQAADAG